jgi:hypothetical protein
MWRFFMPFFQLWMDWRTGARAVHLFQLGDCLSIGQNGSWGYPTHTKFTDRETRSARPGLARQVADQRKSGSESPNH